MKGVTELTPALLTIKPGEPARIRTEVDREVANAGDDINVACVVEDEYGNETTARNIAVRSQPSRGVTVDGNVVSTELVGDYQLECTALGLQREPKIFRYCRPGNPGCGRTFKLRSYGWNKSRGNVPFV